MIVANVSDHVQLNPEGASSRHTTSDDKDRVVSDGCAPDCKHYVDRILLPVSRILNNIVTLLRSLTCGWM